MINRIFIVIMLMFMLFAQYAGIPVQGMTVKVSSVYDETQTADPVLPQSSPDAAPSSGSPASSPGIAPVTDAPSNEVPEQLSAPPSDTPSRSDVPQEAPSSAQPAAPSADPVPGPVISGPLVDCLPPLDSTSPDAITFKNDMKNIVHSAVLKSGMKSPYGLFIMDLKRELYYGINENLTRMDPVDQVPEGFFNSASVIKLFQGYLFCDMLRRGELDSEKIYYDGVTGRKFKLLPMIKSMISFSDNNYSNACLRIVDNKKSNEILSRLGIKNSRLYGEMSGAIGYSRKNNIEKYGTDKRCARLTPQDTGLILYNIYRNRDSDPYMMLLDQALLGNVYTSRIPVGVRRVSSKIPIAHKTGTNSQAGIYNDAGIVYAKNPFILVAFTCETTAGTGNSFIRSLAEQLTRYFDK